MCDRRPGAFARYRARAGQERSLTPSDYVGSFPDADFRLEHDLPEVTFVGRSNVGKSTLLNRLLGRRDLARTSRRPGKTRACNVYYVEDSYYLIDLPGYGYAQVSKSERAAFRKMISRVLLHRKSLTAAIWLLDLRHKPTADDLAMAEDLSQSGVPTLVVATKADKLKKRDREKKAESLARDIGVPRDQLLVTSAETGEGIDDLRESVMAFIGGRDD